MNDHIPDRDQLISATTAETLSETAKSPLVLVVDDDMFMRKILVRYLERDNYAVAEACDGVEAIEVYSQKHPDMILLDAMMPIMDGFECCAKLQNLINGDHIPILIITALDDRESVDRAYEVGASDYVTKPIHWAVLRQRVRRLLEQANLSQQLEAANRQLEVLVQELHRLVSIDGLTQVSSRRCLDEYIEQECRRSQREQQPISMILCDIDFFKNYNDNYGHQEGDECLKKVAQTISQATNRSADMVARYGGEEFAIILPNTDAHGGINVALRANQLVQSLNLPHAYSAAAPHVTISCGIATVLPNEQTKATDLIKAADLALYNAKANGRNCVKFNDQPQAEIHSIAIANQVKT
jgi:diguanylate cyclase (GGDEF)-like protein